MNALMTRSARRPRRIGSAVLAIALAALVGGLASVPARADNDDRGGHEQQRHARVRHPPRPAHGRAAPAYVYAPPPVYYAPPPPPPAIDFVIPLNFR